MNASVAANLAFILFLPWYAILAVLWCVYPRAPNGLVRRTFDAVTLVVATLATIASTQWSYFFADTSVDAMWPQVLATAVSYGVFLAVMVAAFFVRHRCIVKPRASGAHPAHSPASSLGARS
jgi:hypothetical protein